MPASNPERDKYKRRIEQRFHNPEVTAECLRQYDAKIAAETKLAEYMQGQEARETLYREMSAAHREDARKVEEAYRSVEKAMREREKMSVALTEMRGNYAKAAQEASELHGRIDVLVKEKLDIEERYVDLVNSGKAIQDKYDAVIAERDSLDSKVRHLQDQISLGNKDKFGATTERTSKLFDDEFVEEDPLREDMPVPDDSASDASDADDKTAEAEDKVAQDEKTDDGGSDKSGDYSSQAVIDKIWSLITGGGNGKGRKGHKNRNLKKIRKQWKRSGIYDDIADHINVYGYDLDELDRRYAGEKWASLVSMRRRQ